MYSLQDLQKAAGLYNFIATFEEQLHVVSQVILRDLAHLFIRHHMHHDFGVCLLHRHHTLQPNNVMVHTRIAEGVDVCRAEELGRREIYPCAFFSDSQKDFLPFEFEALSIPQPVSPPNKDFLADVASLLWEKGYQYILGLTRVSPSGSPWNETLLPHGKGTIAQQVSRGESAINGTITEWAFAVHQGEVRVLAMKACEEPPSGGHKSS